MLSSKTFCYMSLWHHRVVCLSEILHEQRSQQARNHYAKLHSQILNYYPYQFDQGAYHTKSNPHSQTSNQLRKVLVRHNMLMLACTNPPCFKAELVLLRLPLDWIPRSRSKASTLNMFNAWRVPFPVGWMFENIATWIDKAKLFDAKINQNYLVPFPAG